MDSLLKILWFSYFSLAPVAWLPGLSAPLVYNTKLILIGSVVSLTWISFFIKGGFRLPKGYLGPMGLFIMLLLGASGFMQAESMALGISRYKDIILGFLMFWSMYIYTRRSDEVLKLLFWAAVLVSILAAISVLSKLTGFPSLKSPAVFESMYIHEIGFGGKRGNWASSIALYLAPLLLALVTNNKSIVRSVFVLLACLAILGSQFAVSGRTGLMGSLFIIFFSLFFVLKNTRVLKVLILCGLVSVFFVDNKLDEIASDQLRLEKADAVKSGDVTATLNALSTGRLFQFIYALELIANKPVFGYGFGATVYGMDVHNLWLRLAFEGGILLPIGFFVFVFKLVKITRSREGKKPIEIKGSNKISQKTLLADKKRIIGYLIVAGVLMSFVQPSVLLGAFQVTALWWASAGILIAMSIEERTYDSDLQEGNIEKPINSSNFKSMDTKIEKKPSSRVLFRKK